MSKAYKCDRCGELYEPYGLPKYEVRKTGLSGQCMDLCSDCADTLEKWVKNKVYFTAYDDKEENDAEVFKAGNETE